MVMLEATPPIISWNCSSPACMSSITTFICICPLKPGAIPWPPALAEGGVIPKIAGRTMTYPPSLTADVKPPRFTTVMVNCRRR